MVDVVGASLAALEESLRAELAGHAIVKRSAIGSASQRVGRDIRLRPDDGSALEAGWSEFPDHEIILWAGHGGRWELRWTAGDAAFVERIIRSVVAGRVIETFALHRSRVEVTSSDGTSERTTVGDGGLLSLIPLPGWPKWGRNVHYSAYLPTDR